MQILKPLQQETSRLVKTLLNQNPELMRKYVDTSIGAISYVLGPLNVFMRHLITIQNLDPNSVPGAKAALELKQAYNTLFDKVHEKEYEDDYDISWVQTRFEETQKKLKELQLTKEKFMDITNLTKVDCGVEMEPVVTLQADGDEFTRTVDPVAPDSDKRETCLFDKQEEETFVGKGDQLRKLIDAKKENALQRIKEKILTTSGNTDPLAELKKALVEVIKVATDVEEREEKKEQAVSEEKKLEVVKKKLNKAPRVVFQKEKKQIIKEKIDRAQELINRMVKAGLCSSEPEAIATQISEVLKFNDEGFESLKRIIDRHIAVSTLKTNPFKEYMPYRTVKPYSDRGSLKDLKERQESGDDDKLPVTNFELRVKELYEHAIVRKDEALIESLGLIAINGSPKDPVSIFRHREYVNSLSEKLAGQIKETKLELDACFADLTPNMNTLPNEMKLAEYRQLRSRATILDPETIVKVASADSAEPIKRSFRRVS